MLYIKPAWKITFVALLLILGSSMIAHQKVSADTLLTISSATTINASNTDASTVGGDMFSDCKTPPNKLTYNGSIPNIDPITASKIKNTFVAQCTNKGAFGGNIILSISGLIAATSGNNYNGTLDIYEFTGNIITSQKSINIVLDNPNGIDLAGAGVPVGAAPGPADAQPDDCPVEDGAFRWMLCPIFFIAKTTLTALDNALQNYLYVDTNQIFSDNFHSSFANIRKFGISLVVIAGLAMVISQAAGLEIFSAYTIRKLLPRLIIVAIGIALAWPLMKFAIDFFNDIGGWIQSILLNAVPPPSGGGSANGFDFIMGPVMAVGAGAIAWAILGTGGIFALLGAGILALFVGFMVLAIRQIVIILCIVLAPIAIAAAIIPGTQRLWNFWRSTFITTLVMFPLIMGFLGAGKATAYLVAGTSPVLAILIYFAPYFMLPFAFKMAGGLMANVTNLAQARSRGGFERLGRRRQASMERQRERRASGKLFSGGTYDKDGRGSNLRGRLNRGFQRAALLPSARFDPRHMRANLKSAMESHSTASALEGLEKSEALKEFSQDNDMLAIGRKYKIAETINAALRQAKQGLTDEEYDSMTAKILNARRDLGDKGYAIASVIAEAGTGAGFSNPEDYFKALHEAAGNDADLAGKIHGIAKGQFARANRGDMAGASYSAGMKAYQEVRNGGGSGEKLEDFLVESYLSTDAVSISRGRANGVKNMTEAVSKRITQIEDRRQHPVAGADPVKVEQDDIQLGQLTTSLHSLRQVAPQYAAPDRAAIIDDAHHASESTIYTVDHEVAAHDAQYPRGTFDEDTQTRNQGSPTVRGASAQRPTYGTGQQTGRNPGNPFDVDNQPPASDQDDERRQ